MYENKPIDEWLSDDVISWCHAHHLRACEQLLKHYDGASLLRLYHLSKSNGDKDTLRMLQDDCERSSSAGQLKLTLTEFIRFQSELDKRIEKDVILKNKTTEKKLKPATTCTVV